MLFLNFQILLVDHIPDVVLQLGEAGKHLGLLVSGIGDVDVNNFLDTAGTGGHDHHAFELAPGREFVITTKPSFAFFRDAILRFSVFPIAVIETMIVSEPVISPPITFTPGAAAAMPL